jgi:outer membrane protein
MIVKKKLSKYFTLIVNLFYMKIYVYLIYLALKIYLSTTYIYGTLLVISLAQIIRMNRLKKMVRLILFLTSLTLYSQNNWPLEVCIDYALKHNLKLKDLNYSIKSNQENHKQSFRDLLPSISGNSNYYIQYGRSIDPNTNEIVSSDFFSNNYSINADIEIFRGFQKMNTIASTKFLFKATQEESLQEKYLLAFRVMTAFFDVQFYEGLLQISQEQVNISMTNFNLVKKQIELGLKAGADLYEAESILIADKLIVTQSKNNLEAAQLKLIQEMNLENVTTIKINTVKENTFLAEEKIQQVNADTVYTSALSFMPIIKAQELRVKAAEKDIAIARGSLYPSLSFSAGYGTGYFETNVDATGNVIPFLTQTKDNASQFIGVSLRIPFSQKWSSRSQVKQQKIALLKAVNNLSIQKQELNKIILELIQAYDATLTEYELTKQSEVSRLLAFKTAQKKYNKGLISAVELYQFKNFLANAQNENLQVQLKLKVQEKTLDFYKGLPVFNIQKTIN